MEITLWWYRNSIYPANLRRAVELKKKEKNLLVVTEVLKGVGQKLTQVRSTKEFPQTLGPVPAHLHAALTKKKSPDYLARVVRKEGRAPRRLRTGMC